MFVAGVLLSGVQSSFWRMEGGLAFFRAVFTNLMDYRLGGSRGSVRNLFEAKRSTEN